MSWFNDAQYVESKEISVCNVPDGTYKIKIVDVKGEQVQGKNICNIFFAIDCPDWNKIPYKLTLWEGESFDYNLSRLTDCFGVKFENALKTFDCFNNQHGLALFSHIKNKKINDGFNPDGTTKTKWVKEQSDFCHIKLLKKDVPQAENAYNIY